MRSINFIPVVFGLVFPAGLLLFVHQVAKLPEDPWLVGLPALFDDLGFAMALGFGLPYPKFFAVLALLLAAWVGYRFGRRLVRLLSPSGANRR